MQHLMRMKWIIVHVYFEIKGSMSKFNVAESVGVITCACSKYVKRCIRKGVLVVITSTVMIGLRRCGYSGVPENVHI